MGARIDGIDTAKGAALVMVIGIHSGWPGVATSLTMGLHLPVFFVIAGMFFKPATGWTGFLRGKWRRLAVPFLFFFALGFLEYVIGKPVTDSAGEFDFSLFNIFSVEPRHLTYPAALWFFPAILWCLAMMTAVFLALKRELPRALACLALGAVGWLLSGRVVLPLWLDSSMSCMPLVYLGYAVRRYFFQRIVSGRWWQWAVLVVAVCCGIYYYADLSVGYCYNLYRGPAAAIIVLAALGSVGFIAICCRAGRLPLLGYIGRNSLAIFGIHQHVMILLAPLALPWLPLMLATVTGSAASGWLLRRFLPRMVGERGSGVKDRKLKSNELTI